MASCRFQFDFTGTGDVLVEKIRSHVSGAGGRFLGSAAEGSFSLPTPVGTFGGTYRVFGRTIFLEVLDKPFFVPCGAIEARLLQYIEGAR